MNVNARGGVSVGMRVVSISARLAAGVALCATPAMAGVQLALGREHLPDDWRALHTGTVTNNAVVTLASVVCLVCWVGLVIDGLSGLLEVRRSATTPVELRRSVRLLATVIGASTLAMLAGLRQQTARSGGEVSPTAVASLVTGTSIAGRLHAARSRVSRVQETTRVVLSVEPDRAQPDPRVIVRVFGSPLVEGPDGRRAKFRKSRSLELLTWLALNRERPLRSAARTAIWDSDISDSSFATVVSEMRRGLAELVPELPSHAWSPPTYGDTIALSVAVRTDVELIESLLRRFRSSPASGAEALAEELCRIRDLPFAGSNYAWPDLDGTTTRLVLLAFSAIDELVTWAMECGRGREMAPVVAAGLRMIPGSEEMLELQRRVSRLPAPRRSMASLRP